MTKRLTTWMAIWSLCGLVASGCARSPEGEAETAKVQQASGILFVPEASQRAMGLDTAEVTKSVGRETLDLTGWLVTPPGQEIVIKAPTTGFITFHNVSENPTLGAAVTAGNSLATLEAFVSPQEESQLIAAKEEADTAIRQATVSMELAESQLQQLRQNARDAVAGTRLVDLQEIIGRSRAVIAETREKLPFLPAEPYEGKLALRPVDLEAPLTGSITQVHVSPRQLVVAGDPLWTVSNWSQLWIRVPVFDADLSRVTSDQEAAVKLPGKAASLAASPISSPQQVQPGRRTVDLFYRLNASDISVRPGQTVAVSLPTEVERERIVVPRGSVLWEGLSGTWVYVRIATESFRRQKIELGATLPDGVVVERGLAPGDEVVTVGAGTLYGEEFKSALPADDDD